MDSHQLEGRWNEIKGELKSWWGKLTDDDIEHVAGNKDKLIGVVQQKYGYLYDEAQREIDRRLKEFDETIDRLERTSNALKQKARDVTATVRDKIENLKAGTEDIANATGIHRGDHVVVEPVADVRGFVRCEAALSNDAFEQFTWEPGYVSNYENILFDRERGFTASYMETLLMTENGIETLSRHPRELAVAR